MSATLVVKGFRPADDVFHKMKAVWESCRAAGIRPPKEVEVFFNNEVPDDQGVPVEIKLTPAVRPWDDNDMCEGFEVDLTLLDPTVKVIRFYVAY